MQLFHGKKLRVQGQHNHSRISLAPNNIEFSAHEKFIKVCVNEKLIDSWKDVSAPISYIVTSP